MMRLILTVALVVVAAAPAMAQRPTDKPAKANPKSAKDQPAVTVRVVFHDSDRAIFREYYGTRRTGVKPLPPGIAKNLARGKPLPPGIAKTRVPDEVLVRMTWRPPGYTLFLLGDRVVLVNPQGLVADILDAIF